MRVYLIYFFANILTHLAVHQGYFSKNIYHLDWQKDLDNKEYYKFLTSFLNNGTFVSGFSKEYVVPFFSGENLGAFLSIWLFYTGLVQLRNSYKSMSELESPSLTNKSQKHHSIRFIIMLLFVVLSILSYGFLLPYIAKNQTFIDMYTQFQEQISKYLNLNPELLSVFVTPVTNYIPFTMAFYTIYCLRSPYYGTDCLLFTLRNYMLPYVQIFFYVWLGMNTGMGPFYDYTIFHMIMGMFIGKTYIKFENLLKLNK